MRDEYNASVREVLTDMRAPAGSENPAGFSSLREFNPRFAFVLSPILAEESAAGRQNTVMRRL
jgi:hypothetical protein